MREEWTNQTIMVSGYENSFKQAALKTWTLENNKVGNTEPHLNPCQKDFPNYWMNTVQNPLKTQQQTSCQKRRLMTKNYKVCDGTNLKTGKSCRKKDRQQW